MQPQAFLGVAINWGTLQGWATVRGSIETPVIAPLYVAAICWTLVYDTIYAHQVCFCFLFALFCLQYHLHWFVGHEMLAYMEAKHLLSVQSI
jgi:4-hydroxybenzoate polyprenyltransferase